jgi:hypothetical protein
MTSPKETDVLAWLKREEIDVRDPKAIMRLQMKLAAATSRSQQSYYKHMLNMAAYQVNTLKPLGVTAIVHPESLYRTVGFSIEGKPGFWSWESVRNMFNLRGPRKTGEFD